MPHFGDSTSPWACAKASSSIRAITTQSSIRNCAEYFLDQRPPLEAQLIDLADEIAYLTADLDDGLDSGMLTLEQVREGVTLFRTLP